MSSLRARLNEVGDQVAREVQLAADGYTVGVENMAVLGCFAGSFFMRSRHAARTLCVARTSRARLEREWRSFRAPALDG